MATNCNCYLNPSIRCPHFDMTDIQRVTITDSMTDKEKELFQGYNDNCEAIEDLWIELDLQRIDQMEEAAKKLQVRNAKKRESDNRKYVANLHKQGFSLAEIASITKLDHEKIFNWVHRPNRVRHSGNGTNRSTAYYGLDSSVRDEVYGTFEGCPDEIAADLEEADFDLK